MLLRRDIGDAYVMALLLLLHYTRVYIQRGSDYYSSCLRLCTTAHLRHARTNVQYAQYIRPYIIVKWSQSHVRL